MDSILILLIGIATVLFCIIFLKLHAFLSLLIAALVTGLLTNSGQIFSYAINNNMSEAAAKALSEQTIGARLANALGNTASKIGILIALASIIGTALMKSGAAERIVRSLTNIIGKQNTSLAFLASSFTLGIPIFFDTVFYLMIPIVKSAGIRNPSKYSLYVMCAIAGGVMTHSLVPPTPGPLFVARELNVDIGVMMVWGVLVGAVTVAAGYLYALWANKKWDLPLRDSPDVSVEELKLKSNINESFLPGLGLSLLPILLPIVLITGNTLLDMITNSRSTLLDLFKIIGDSNIALLIATGPALYLLWYKNKDFKLFEKNVSEALTSAGMIILITSAGGTFGQMLQQTNIGEKIAALALAHQTAILPLAFMITAIVRSAQGSATVAMVTAIGVMSGVGNANNLGFHPVYLAIVIGCGSKIFAWMNDSGFWIVTKMAGMETNEGIKFFSTLMTIMGVVGLIVTMLLAYFFPLV